VVGGGRVNSLGTYTAPLNADTVLVIATFRLGALADTALVTLAAASPSDSTPVSGLTHEPPGYTRITSRDFGSKAKTDADRGPTGSQGWDGVEYRYHKVQIDTDSTAPVSPSGILRLLYPAQTVAKGTTYNPGVVQTLSFTGSAYGARQYRKLYLRTAIRVSPNFQGHPTTTNKLIFIRGEDEANGNRAEPIIRLRGVGAGPLTLSVDPQGMLRDKRQLRGVSPNAQSFSPNRGSGGVTRGAWHVIEAVLEMGQNGAANGRLRIWLDGTLTHDYGDLEYERTAKIRYWNTVVIAPTWGGVGGTINQTMWLDFDEFFVSGAP
jgi:hypothetical protein